MPGRRHPPGVIFIQLFFIYFRRCAAYNIVRVKQAVIENLPGVGVHLGFSDKRFYAIDKREPDFFMNGRTGGHEAA